MKRTAMRMGLLILAAMITWMIPASAVLAEEADADVREPYLELSTQYPALTVKAGDNLSFDLAIDNYTGQSQDVALSIAQIPEGWTGSFSADGNWISVAHVRDGEVADAVDFTVEVPLDASEGEYIVALRAEGEGYADQIEIALQVSAEEIGASKFTVEYPSQEGDDTTQFAFSATLINDTLTAQSYSLSAGAPAGWQVSFTPSGESTKVAALDVEAGATQGVQINVTPPENVAAGVYEIPCTATSASENLSIALSVTITGSYDLALSTPSGLLSLDAYANRESAVQLSLTNTGNTDLTNVNLTSSAPTGWTVRFSTETIELIESGATVEATAYITPGEDAMSGDYLTTISAAESNVSDSAEFRVTVKTETKWGIVGIAVIVVLVVVVVAVMRKYGRR